MANQNKSNRKDQKSNQPCGNNRNSRKNQRSQSYKKEQQAQRGNKPEDPKSGDRTEEVEAQAGATEYEPKTNDPEWYASSPQLLSDAASVPFSYTAGLPFSYGSVGGFSQMWVSPGVCVYYMRPGLPKTTQAGDALNAVSLKQFAFFRSTVSSRLPYEPADLTVMEIAMGQAYSFINWATRAYAIASNLFVNENRYLPERLLQVQGIDPYSLSNHLNDFRGWLNLLITRASALSVPKDMYYFRRMAMLYANIYTEGTSVKDQLYMYSPMGFWQFQDVPGNGSTGAWLKYVPLLEQMDADKFGEQNLLTWEEIQTYGNNLLNALYGSEDVGVMSANILRAYGSEHVLTLELVPEFPAITPIFDIGVLEQMQNTCPVTNGLMQNIGKSKTASGQTVVDNDWSVKQTVLNKDTDPVTYLTFSPAIYNNATDNTPNRIRNLQASAFAGLNKILTTTTASTDPKLVIESTRGMTYFEEEKSVSTGTPNYWLHCCTDCCVECIIYQKDPNTVGYQVLTTMISDMNAASVPWVDIADTSAATTSLKSLVAKRILYDAFRFRCNQMLITAELNPTSGGLPMVQNVSPVGLIDNFAVITHLVLNKMNDQAAYALFDISVKVSPY